VRLCSFAALALLTACGEPPCAVPNTADLVPGEATGPLMRPGSNCLRCHAAGGRAAGAPFSVGGTVFPARDSEVCGGVMGVTIEVTDSRGKQLRLVSNAAGNFYSQEPLEPPLSLAAEYQGRALAMPVTTPTGGCALCHSWPDAVSASGRIRAP